ncbi:MAG: amino acid carrier protein [Chlamydiales bacterium]
MFSSFFDHLTKLDDFFWGYCAFAIVLSLSIFLTIRLRFFQILHLPKFVKTFFQHLGKNEESDRGVHPLKAFFASTGGMIGIGNVVGVATAVQLGGPGALFWLWVAGILGSIVKYCEIYLGFKYRVENEHGGYDGGPMYFLKRAFKIRVLPFIVAVLLCVYGVEIYQFSVITESVSTNWHIPHVVAIVLLLGAVFWAAGGGIARIGQICSWVVPIFLVIYIGMGLYVVISEAALLPHMMLSVIKSAFTGHAAVGGFVGSSFILAAQQGISRAAYSADIGIGYDSIIQSESSTQYPIRQARLAILGVFIDNIVCSLSILVVILSDAWTFFGPSAQGSQVVQAAFSQYFPYMQLFLPFFYLITGYTTIIAYLIVGIKCARYLAPKIGPRLYMLYGIAAFIFFSFMPQKHALLVMSLAGALLLMINLLGIFRLRHEITFHEESSLKA